SLFGRRTTEGLVWRTKHGVFADWQRSQHLPVDSFLRKYLRFSLELILLYSSLEAPGGHFVLMSIKPQL
ncbi:hypothetical protein ANCDUO_21791, partial [Ancylostoma duodenale]